MYVHRFEKAKIFLNKQPLFVSEKNVPTVMMDTI